MRGPEVAWVGVAPCKFRGIVGNGSEWQHVVNGIRAGVSADVADVALLGEQSSIALLSCPAAHALVVLTHASALIQSSTSRSTSSSISTLRLSCSE